MAKEKMQKDLIYTVVSKKFKNTNLLSQVKGKKGGEEEYENGDEKRRKTRAMAMKEK